MVGPFVRREDGQAVFPCRCACGTERDVVFRVLREAQAGKVVGSCGCAHADSMAAKRRYGDPSTPEYKRARWLRARYGITLADWDALLVEQTGRCAVCVRPLTDDLQPRVDHCHETDTIRGLLCHHCNVGLGHFGDDVGRLRNAARYLLQTRAMTTQQQGGAL